jgi:hypothetical protein
MPILQEVSQDYTNQLQNELAQNGNFSLPKSWFISKDVLIDAFDLNPASLTNYSGLRIYPGAKMEETVSNDNPTITLIAVAVSIDGKDIVGNVPPAISIGSKRYDYSLPCPISCPTNSTDLLMFSSIYKLSK